MITMLFLLVGPVIIAVMHRPKSLTELYEMFSLSASWSEIRFYWMLCGIIVASLISLWPTTWGGGSRIVTEIIGKAQTEGGSAYIVAAMVLGPIPEEAILRGYLYRTFSAVYGRRIGIVIVALLNVALHSNSINGSLFAACFFTVMGILLCYIFDSRRNLLDCIVFHVGYNATIIFLALL